MKTFMQFVEELDFGDPKSFLAKIRARGPVVNSKTVSKPNVLTLYHGFNINPESFNYVFDPRKSEQGLLWFTHSMIRGYNAYEYAASRGNYLLTYPLKTIVHQDEVTYQDGSESTKAPESIAKLADSLENSKYLLYFDSVIELPEGWFFTYKSEKFIGTNQIVKANPSMITQTGNNGM